MGGKWIIRLRKGLASRCWENLILAMLGEQFMVGEEICGAVVSVRFQVNPRADSRTCFHLITHTLSKLRHAFSASPLSRRTSSPSGTKPPATRRPLPASETPCVESSTCLPTPSWSTRLTQTALSMYVSSFYYFFFNLSLSLSHTFMNVCMLTNSTFCLTVVIVIVIL